MTAGRRGGEGSRGRTLISRVVVAAALAGSMSSRVAAQDTAIVIRPIPSAADTIQAGLPAEVVRQVVAFYNDSTTLRFHGSLSVPAGAQLRGRVAVFRGTLRVFGRIDGTVMVINGDLIIAAGGTVVGPVTVAGGRIDLRRGGTHQGEATSYDPLASVYRQPT
ncbi:MAG: hypothetical protein ACREMO_04185, partial [Gemmatimonadales bacterium]